MLTCKSVSNALERADYHDLSPFRQKLLKLHIRMCGMCGPYNGFVVTMQDTAHEFREHEDQQLSKQTEQLPLNLAMDLKKAAREIPSSQS